MPHPTHCAPIGSLRSVTERGVSCRVPARPHPRGPDCPSLRTRRRAADTATMGDRNVLGTELEPCGSDPLTGFYRDGCCTTGPEDLGLHTICAVVPPSSSPTSAGSATTCPPRCRSSASLAWCRGTGGA